MKRRNRKLLQRKLENQEVTNASFLSNSELISYNADTIEVIKPKKLEDINLNIEQINAWYNLYGFEYFSDLQQVLKNNAVDEFMLLIISNDDHRNKAIEIPNGLIFTIKAIAHNPDLEQQQISAEQMVFALGKNYLISIQEKDGDHFDHVRERIKNKQGMVRYKSIGYLFFLLIDAIIDNYIINVNALAKANLRLQDKNTINASTDFVTDVEAYKHNLYYVQKLSFSLKEALLQMERIENPIIQKKYVNELKGQLDYLNDEIVQNIQKLESTINLVFTMQNQRLNEIMKTLTIFSVVFIPITFLAGVYGMNFNHMPELDFKYGYYVVLAIMFLFVIISIFMVRRGRWFK